MAKRTKPKPPIHNEEITDGEFYGRKIYTWLIEHGSDCPDIEIIREELDITESQMKSGLNWCDAKELINFYLH